MKANLFLCFSNFRVMGCFTLPVEHQIMSHLRYFTFNLVELELSDNTFLWYYVDCICYCSFQVLRDQGYDGTASDVWSCGVILYVLMAGFLPFSESSLVVLYRKVSKLTLLFFTFFNFRDLPYAYQCMSESNFRSAELISHFHRGFHLVQRN
jgi:serine/threonine protein kinase